jgi:hypothetical protein
MPRLSLLAAVAALTVACPAAALAADPIPGATYEGTTDTGSPFSLKVSPDGTAVTDILTSAALSCVGPEGGVEVMAIVSTVPIPVSGGVISGKDEETVPRLDAVNGTFTSPQEVKGTIQAATSKFKLGEGVTSCMREVAFTARTTAAAPAATTTPAPSVTPPAGPVAAGAPAVTLTGRSSAKLLTALRRGFAVTGTVGAPARIVATARLAAKDARRYGVSRTLARSTTRAAAPGAFSVKLKPSAATARKLRKARRLKVAVTLVSTSLPSSAPTTSTRTITLAR